MWHYWNNVYCRIWLNQWWDRKFRQLYNSLSKFKVCRFGTFMHDLIYFAWLKQMLRVAMDAQRASNEQTYESNGRTNKSEEVASRLILRGKGAYQKDWHFLLLTTSNIGFILQDKSNIWDRSSEWSWATILFSRQRSCFLQECITAFCIFKSISAMKKIKKK